MNELTGAHAKVGSYAFTTLNPNLGVLYGYVLADIPGLIEGASEGKGLGHQFLRHITRTKMILHCLSLEHESLAEAYATIRGELATYDEELAAKPERIILTKTDLVDAKTFEAKKKEFCKKTKKSAKEVLSVTVFDDASLKLLAEALTQSLGGK